MHEFQCGHQECGRRIVAADKDHLMRQVVEHLRSVHKVDQVTDALMNYLEVTCVTTRET